MPRFGFRRAQSKSDSVADGLSTPPVLVTEAVVLQALRSVIDPDFQRDVVSLGMIKNLQIALGDDGVRVQFTFELTTPACPLRDELEAQARTAVSAVPGVSQVDVQMTANVRAPSGGPHRAELKGVKNVIGVASGKGGVGKSTVAVNLACSLARSGAQVGILDADVYGPSVPTLLSVRDAPRVLEDRIQPLEAYGLRVMSMGFLISEDEPIVWRGPMISQAVTQMIQEVEWGDLDYLIIDLPPGTGDVQLTTAQVLSLTGVVIVSTPQHVALGIASKAYGMFKQLHVPILGFVENMSYFVCPACGDRTDVFSHGGARQLCEHLKVPFLGEIPLDQALRESGDEGRPVTASDQPSPQRDAFDHVARALARQASIRAARVLPLLQVQER
ncbi:MAG: Mrp/NBP35 family ATP-binding protein [Chloroflexi bacterium]|nr:Mrp/NBP35 family ATP-binding protein [Chloroflexota bacterium]